MRFLKRSALLAVSLCAVLAASCSLFQTNPNGPQLQTARLAIQYGVGRYVSSRPAEKRADTLTRIRSIVTDVQHAAAGERITLTLLREEVVKRLPADLRPEDRIAINGLLDIVVQTISQCVTGAGDAGSPCGPDVKLPPDAKVALNTVAMWILEVVDQYPSARADRARRHRFA